jgi:hypothetical protein
VSSEEVEAIAHMEDMAHNVEAWENCDIVEAWVAGSNSRHRVAYSYYTSAADTADADADADYMASFYPHLAAFLALPADDVRSSCRLRGVAFPTDRVLGRTGAARCGWNRGRCRVFLEIEDCQRI